MAMLNLQSCIRNFYRKKSLIVAVVSGLSLGAAIDLYANSELIDFDIKHQKLATALLELGQTAGIEIVVPRNMYSESQEVELKGNYQLEKALELMLADSGLSYRFASDTTVVVTEGKKSNGEKEADSKQNSIEEIIVTASKRGSGVSIQDTSMSISALSSANIEKRNLVSMEDYLRTIPGVSFQDLGAGQNSIVIRGFATSPQVENSTAGSYFGETPVSNLGTASNTGGAGNADIKLVDIERIEVLRGPQGTLYGSGSVSGTVRIIPKAPNLNQVEGSIATRLSTTDKAGGSNNSVQGVLNVPLVEDKLAVRAVAYRFDNSGFINNVAASQPTSQLSDLVDNYGVVVKDKGDRGSDTYTGFRLSALWQVTDALSATLTYVNQEIEQDGLPEVNLYAAGNFQQQRPQLGRDQNIDEFLGTELQLTSLELSYDLGWGAITSATSWIDNDSTINVDASPWTGGPYYGDNNQSFDVLVEELRISSQWEGPLQFVAGLYYEDRENWIDNAIHWYGDQSLDPFPPPGLPFSKLGRYQKRGQKAAFGELTYDFTPQWSATLGIRYFDYDFKRVQTYAAGGVLQYEDREIRSDETGQTYKGALSYQPDDNLLFYGQWAQGFRVGYAGNQSAACTAAGVTVPDVESDRSETMEVGLKSSWLDNRVVFNASIYQTDWDDIPVSVTSPCYRVLNGGKAKSKGVEVELNAILTDNLQLDISASTVDATLEETSSIGDAGDDLPGSADYNASIGLEYGFTFADNPSFARLDYSYVGEYYSNVDGTGIPAGDFSQLHLKIGTQVGQVNVDLFVNNLTNDDGLTWVESLLSSFSGFASYSGFRVRPRTIGMNIGYHF